QVQFRLTLGLRAGPPQTHNGVIRTAHPNGSYLVGFEDGTTRDQVLVRFLTGFDWTPHGSKAYQRAATDTSEATTAAAAAAASRGQGRGVGDGSHGATAGAGAVSPLDSGKPSKVPPRGSMFDRFGFSGKVFPDGGGLWGTTGGGGGGSVLQRRATHGGVVDSGEPGLRVDVNMMHFRSQFMDPDTAAQAILTPNNAGMFRPHVVGRGGGGGRGGHRQTVSELSYNSTTDESDADRDEEGDSNNMAAVHRPWDHTRTKKNVGPRSSSKKKNAARVVPVAPKGSAPKRRMTFGGIRSDKRGEVYKEQRRPSFLKDIGRRATEVAEAAAKATRKISIHGNNGQGFELVAIGDRKQSTHEDGRRKSAKKGGKDAGQNNSDSDHSENETHFYNRLRHVFEPQHTESAPSAWWIRTIGVINLLCMAAYLWWRITRSLIGVDHIIWAFIFLIAECIMAIGLIVGHSSRSFPAHREKVYMDDLTDIDEAIGALKVAVLVPTCGEKTAVMLKALFGNLQLRLWKSKNPRRDTLRILVLDEKRREEVQKLVSLVYTLAEVVLDKTVREILMREGVAPISAKGFYDHFANGEHGQRMYDDVNFIRGIEIVSEIDKLIAENDDHISRFSPSVAISRIKERARRASCFDRKEIQPGQKKVWNRNKYIPTIVYYSRIDAGQPRISPKAGNMNRAIFSFNPQEEPLIGEAAVIVVNDVRHELYPEFLQRTVPYFFTFDKPRRCYKWANIAFIQTPQRFHDRTDWNDPDPLGNQAATQFDIVNSGRDGAGGALSCGQGSVWRVQVLRDGIRPDGTKFIKKGMMEDQVGQQGGLGFRAEVLIEDTHTSIDLFRQGWKSVYVNFPNERLACCTLPPDTVKWRWKQVLRWHQGAVQLAMWKGWGYAVLGENWGTTFQKASNGEAEISTLQLKMESVFAFDAVSYFLQAFAGEVLLIFPIVYGFTNSAPFNTWNIEFALYFFPFIITGVLPTVAALGWQKTPSAKVMRDEQIWFATSFVQIYAVMHAVWGTITRKDPSNAWECKCPVWPLYVHFVAVIIAVCFNTADWAARSYEEPWVWVSCIGSALFALHSLWPVVSFGLGVTMPEAFYTRVFGMLVVMTLVSLWLLGESE
ncbi:unnamed protein product, partial [Ectocarpus fasciculatus]